MPITVNMLNSCECLRTAANIREHSLTWLNTARICCNSGKLWNYVKTRGICATWRNFAKLGGHGETWGTWWNLVEAVETLWVIVNNRESVRGIVQNGETLSTVVKWWKMLELVEMVKHCEQLWKMWKMVNNSANIIYPWLTMHSSQ
jgi:hypothetical protein